MINKLKNLCALQIARQLSAAVMLCMLCVFWGCKENKESTKMNEETFLKNLESAPVDLVPVETLPEWLQERIIHFEKLSSFTAYIYKGEWENQTIYLDKNNFQSFLGGVPYYENGEPIFSYDEDGEKLFSESLVESFRSSSKNWVLIWKKEGLLPNSELSYSRAKDKYEFPDISGMNDWMRPNIIQERLAALQIPDAVLASISTAGLLETCLEFPYLINIFHADNFQL